ncbi:MAG: glycosyltransferase family 4 protein [Acetobacteraceae bacterium]|nr:glycosyltransferase family 4 protein [Acetobacteraceae bacterium]
MSSGSLDSRLAPLHRLWRILPARQRRALLWRATAMLAPRPRHPAPPAREGMWVAGELSRASGLGEVARLMLKGLDQLGVASWQIDLAHAIGAPSDLPAVPTTRPPPGVPLLLHVNAPQVPLALLRLPRALLRNRQLIGYWAWELPVVPSLWNGGASFVHEAWVLSRFTAAAVEPLLPGRVRVVPPPLAAAPPVASALDRAAFGLPEKAVVILVSFNLASSFQRKNPLGVVAAFRAAFGNRGDRLLLLKIGNPADFPDNFRVLREAVADAPNIRLDTRTLPAADRHALTRAADIVLSLHRSEGFGLVPAEAMLLGRPVIATGWSGNMEYMDAESARLVAYRLVPARDPRGVFEAPDAVWAEPDQRDTIASLRSLADDPELRASLGERGRLAAERRLGLGPLAEALRALGLAPAQ